MRNKLLGEVWESFFIEGHKVGFLRRVTTTTETPNLLVSTLYIMYGTATFQHTFSFYDKVGYPPHSYLFDTNDGAPIHVRLADNKLICQVDEEIFTEIVPANARPSYGNYPLIVTIPFEAGFKHTFSQIDDASGTLQGITELVSHGWENIVIDNQCYQLWRVDEYTNNQLCSRYWLDENRCLRQSQWQGAVSYWAATKEEAFNDLPTELIAYANALFDNGDDSDWTNIIEKWLGQNE